MRSNKQQQQQIDRSKTSIDLQKSMEQKLQSRMETKVVVQIGELDGRDGIDGVNGVENGVEIEGNDNQVGGSNNDGSEESSAGSKVDMNRLDSADRVDPFNENIGLDGGREVNNIDEVDEIHAHGDGNAENMIETKDGKWDDDDMNNSIKVDDSDNKVNEKVKLCSEIELEKLNTVDKQSERLSIDGKLVNSDKSIPSIASIISSNESPIRPISPGPRSITPDFHQHSISPGLSTASHSIYSDIDSAAIDTGIIDTSDIDNRLKYTHNEVNDAYIDEDPDHENNEANGFLLKLLTTLSLYSGFHKKYDEYGEEDVEEEEEKVEGDDVDLLKMDGDGSTNDSKEPENDTADLTDDNNDNLNDSNALNDKESDIANANETPSETSDETESENIAESVQPVVDNVVDDEAIIDNDKNADDNVNTGILQSTETSTNDKGIERIDTTPVNPEVEGFGRTIDDNENDLHNNDLNNDNETQSSTNNSKPESDDDLKIDSKVGQKPPRNVVKIDSKAFVYDNHQHLDQFDVMFNQPTMSQPITNETITSREILQTTTIPLEFLVEKPDSNITGPQKVHDKVDYFNHQSASSNFQYFDESKTATPFEATKTSTTNIPTFATTTPTPVESHCLTGTQIGSPRTKMSDSSSTTDHSSITTVRPTTTSNMDIYSTTLPEGFGDAVTLNEKEQSSTDTSNYPTTPTKSSTRSSVDRLPIHSNSVAIPGSYPNNTPLRDRRHSVTSVTRVPGAFKVNDMYSNTSSSTPKASPILNQYGTFSGTGSSIYSHSSQYHNDDTDASVYFDTQDNRTVTSDNISNTTTFTALDYPTNKDNDFEMNIMGKTILQKSVVRNLDNFVFDEGVLSTKGENNHSNSHLKKLQSLKLKVADKLQKVFKIDDYDYFQGNITAWLVKDVLLQGHLYLTNDCLMYFAFLPKPCNYKDSNYTKIDDSVQIFQQGALGMKTANYGETMFKSVATHRYWVVLRLDTLSIYSSSTELYFPKIIIDLKTCLRAEIIEDDKPSRNALPKSGTQSRRNSNDCIMSPIEGILSPALRRMVSSSSENSENDDEIDQQLSTSEDNPEQLQDGIWFRLTTDKKTYRFYADNYYTARHWCNNLTKLIFRLQNSNANQEVLMKVPIQNITKISKSSVLGEPGDFSEDNAKSNGLYIEYVSTNENMNSRTTSPKDSKSKQEKGQLVIESITFAFFTETERFFNKLTKVMSSYKDTEEERRKSELLKLKSRSNKLNLLHRNKENSSERQYEQSISTLLPSTVPNHIFDQFIAANAHLQSEYSNLPTFSPESKKPSALKKIGKTLNPRSILSRRKSDSSSSISSTTSGYLQNNSTSSFSSDIFSSEFSVLCPRPLSVNGLRNLQMKFQITKKDPRIAEYLYSTEEEQNEQSIELANPLGLEDPVDLQKSSTFRSIGKSINVFSSLAKLFTSNPSHYYQEDINDPYYVSDEEERVVSLKRYISHFAVKNPVLIASYYVCLQRTGLPVYGKLYIGEEEICFRSLLPGVSTKMILPLSSIEIITKARGIKLAYSALRIIMHGADEYFLEFGSQSARDDCENVGILQLQKLHNDENWIPGTHDWGPNYSICRSKIEDKTSHTDDDDNLSTDSILAMERIARARVKLFEDKVNFASGMDIPIILEDSPFFKTEVRPSVPYNFLLLTIGSRGDVQPYIALGKELIKEGHNVTIATHSEFEGWIRKHGLNFKVIAGNPAELMSLMVSHGSVSVGFIKEAASKFKGWIVELLHTSWEACQGCDIIIESPSAMCGIHIAEALGVPYMRAFTMPWTKTKAYPHAFIVPEQKRGGSYNYLTHIMFETILWKGISNQVNKWRVNELDLPRTNLFRMQQNKVPFIYNVSPSILPPAVDFPDWVNVTGYWFLEEGSAKDYDPPKELIDFLQNAKEQGKRVVYIGFGSIVVKDAKAMTSAVVDAVIDADVRCILNKGWSDRLSKEEDIPEVELPAEIYNSGSIPHDWLFPKIDAAVHHGGSGTTGACLRAGLPTVIKPFFGDQFFYAMRIEDIGVGLGLKKLNSKSLSKAIKTVVSDVKMIEKVRKISGNIKKDNGKLRAIEQIYCNLTYAENLIAAKQTYNENYKKHNPDFKTSSEPVTPAEEIDDIFDEHMYNLQPTPRLSESSA